MEKKYVVVKDPLTALPVKNATVLVQSYIGGAVTIYNSNSLADPLPSSTLTTDAYGTVWCYLPNGRYRFVITPPSAVAYTLTDVIALDIADVVLTPNWASPGAIGSTTPNSGAFTSLSASGTVSGVGFSAYLASPPAIGGTAPAAAAFTTLSASSTVSGAGFTSLFASPPAIGGTTPAAGSFTTLSASGTVSGAGFSTYLASPPNIGGTAQNAGTFSGINSKTKTPATPTGVGSGTGGTVAAGTYYAKIVAVDINGNVSLPGGESTGVVTTGATSSIAWSWTATPGASSYQIWVGTAPGAENSYFTSATPSYTQTTTSGTAGTPPTVNQYGSINAEGYLTAAICKVGTTGTFAPGGVMQVKHSASSGWIETWTESTNTQVMGVYMSGGGGKVSIGAYTAHDLGFFTNNGSSTTMYLSNADSKLYVSAGFSGNVYDHTTTYTVATLPTGASGRRAFVSDALAPTWGAAVTGGGAVRIPVYHDGTSWKAG